MKTHLLCIAGSCWCPCVAWWSWPAGCWSSWGAPRRSRPSSCQTSRDFAGSEEWKVIEMQNLQLRQLKLIKQRIFSLPYYWPCVTLTYILPTYCWHFSGFILSPENIQLNISPLLLGKTLLAGGFRTLSELVGWLRVRRLRRSFSRPQDCFGIDARGSELFPGRGHYVPKRARHTLAHFSLQGTNTGGLSGNTM